MNIKRNLIAASVLAIGFAGAVPAMADNDETTVTTVTKTTGHHYVYYGDHDIYYAPESKTYYWENDGAWKSGTELPSDRRTYVTSGGVRLELNTEHPYERHEWVRKHYKDKHDGDEMRERDDD